MSDWFSVFFSRNPALGAGVVSRPAPRVTTPSEERLRRRLDLEAAYERATSAAERFRLRAEEYHTIADGCISDQGRKTNLEIAAVYLRLAERSREMENAARAGES
jgi:hypothetical protein